MAGADVLVQIVDESTKIVTQVEVKESKSKNASQQTPCYPLPFGYVPYTIALPQAMGPLMEFPTEWWFYAGWAADMTGNMQFTILMQTLRITTPASTKGKSVTCGGIMYGIGIINQVSNQQWFTTNFGMGSTCKFPSPTSSSWSTAVTTSNEQTMTCSLVSGTTGLSGATYQLDMTDSKRSFAVSLLVKDEFGMVMEAASGAFRKAGGEASFEFAMPRLSIMKGKSSITISGEKHDLGSGNIWLERQTIGSADIHSYGFTPDMKPELAIDKPFKSLYIGNWLAVYMNDGNHYSLAFFWKKKTDQWIVGDKLKPPIPPEMKIGLEYPSQKNWNKSSPVQGVNVLEGSQFDLNILYPRDVKRSPHWKSLKSGHTYCTAWELKILDQVYSMTAFIQSSEVWLGTYFFEGAATIRNKKGQAVGHAFVEQMGYN